MSDTDNDYLISTVTIHRYLTEDGTDDYITVEAVDTGGETLRLVESFGMQELARMHFTAEQYGFDTGIDVDE